MNLLLDTHIALWAITDSPKLCEKARQLIESPRASVWVSVASLWEITIKHALARGDMPISGKEALGFFEASGYRLLAIESEHVTAVADLPAHHHDPFDRLIFAQSVIEPMRLITRDAKLAGYGDNVIKV